MSIVLFTDFTGEAFDPDASVNNAVSAAIPSEGLGAISTEQSIEAATGARFNRGLN